MQDVLLDIRKRLSNKEYHNEEHIRFSLVARVVQECGWDIWNPTEVYTEFKATIKEDNTRVDVALFTHDFDSTAVFIECKALGAFAADLGPVERQLRDYNRDHTALFTIITDGQHWRFYFSFTSGEFKDKLFCKFDLLQDGQDEVAACLDTFLRRENIVNGTARQEAEAYLMLGKKDRAMKDVLPDAQKLVSHPPFLSLPHAMVQLLAGKNLTITPSEAQDFLTGVSSVRTASPSGHTTAYRATALTAVVEKKKALVIASVPELTESSKLPEAEGNTFFLLLKRTGIKAAAKWDATARRLRVQAGSTAMLESSPSLSPGLVKLREKLISQHVLSEKDGKLIFQTDYVFETLMQAAGTVCGYSVNGRQAWRDADNKPLAEYLDASPEAG